MAKKQEKQVELDPFHYGKADVLTAVVQLAVAITGIVLAIQGDTSALLGLGALAGGTKGSMLGDILKIVAKAKKTNTTLCVALLAFVLLSGCGATSITRQFIVDSQAAVYAVAGDYVDGCTMITLAPGFALTVDGSEMSYSGALFAGCEDNGRLMELRCIGLKDEITGKTRIQCAPFALWEQVERAK